MRFASGLPRLAPHPRGLRTHSSRRGGHRPWRREHRQEQGRCSR
ncbi:hypothetical protein SLNWT_1930 [Streptomyces albus]|uniref:Uncharacterized protein n=1 Tax=Streptomyces albus (strain ATCC 21838 / DSM 41398 / FERM P-419 / JCM 4703 / NBRC 107858) TaxID=1081613 RepID=A0A0B5EUC0_STRA4|nr:hypothetical protein SLNWT_1930 [Streptomyces albus]AOU76622.1 hypothetical protein SLNHY_1931 [Streptomyces albus]